MSSLHEKESDVAVEKVSNTTDPYQTVSAPSAWTRFKHSFRRAEETVPIADMEGLSDIDRANLGAARAPLSKELKNRHLQMIAIGGLVGTGLLVGSGSSLRTGGPAALLIAWGLVGTMVFCVIHALGELAIAFPVSGAFLSYATRFVDLSWGFAVGWNYAIMWLIVLPLELVAAAMSIKYWNDSINPVAWVSIFYFVIVLINLFGVKGYGEAEFYLAIVKIVAIVGFIIMGVVLVCGGGPHHEFIGANRWRQGGSFANGFKGVCTVFVTASYSLAGSELVGLAAAELANPRKTLPKAIKQVFWRIFLFYFLLLTFIGLLVPCDDEKLLGASDNAASPFVLAIKNSGIYALPSIFNAVILIAVVSVGNAAVYGCLRTIQSLGAQGLGPRWLDYVDTRGRPVAGLCILGVFGLLCFLSAYKDEGQVFAWLLSVSGLSTIFSWFSIGLCHLRFRMAMRAQGRSVFDELTFTCLTGLWGTIYSMVLLVVVLVVQFWVALWPTRKNGSTDVKNFFQNYLGVFVILIFYVGHKVWRRNWRWYIPLLEIDLDTGRKLTDLDIIKQEILVEREYYQALPWYKKVYSAWC
jgi:amino acid transporter